MTNDLSLHYHIGILDGLYDLKRLLLQNEVPENLLPPNLNEVLLKAAKVVMHFTYPSYFTKNSKDCTPAFNDSWVKTRSVLNKTLRNIWKCFLKIPSLNICSRMVKVALVRVNNK